MTEPKFQFSKFSPDRSEQIVLRCDNREEFDKLVGIYRDTMGQTQAFPDDSGPTATTVAQTVPQARMCSFHVGVAMKERHGKNGDVFYSHARRLPNGIFEYCNGRLGYPSEQKAIDAG